MYFNEKPRIAIFHDMDNVPPLHLINGGKLFDQLVRYVRKTGYIETYKMFLSNLVYESSIDEMINSIASCLGTYTTRFNKIIAPTPPDGINLIDYVLLEHLYIYVDHNPGVNHYLLISGDRDFYPGIVFLKIKRKQISVLGDDSNTSHLLDDYRIM